MSSLEKAPGGDVLLAEIREQPEALQRVLDHGLEAIKSVARAVRTRQPRLVRLIGHGTSGNAAELALRCFARSAGMTAFRDSISLSIYDKADLDFGDSLVIGISQSGRTPDVIDYLERAKNRGATTVAVTNEEASPLAEAAEHTLLLHAGPERALAATKTYMTELATLNLLAGFVGEHGEKLARGVRAVAELAAAALPRLEEEVGALVFELGAFGSCFVVARGIEFATAREIALKLTETCKLTCVALTSTEFQHGPVVAASTAVPVLAIASHDSCLASVARAAERAREIGASVVALGEAAAELSSAKLAVSTPRSPDPLLAPLLSVLPGQLIAWSLSRRLGVNIDQEAFLSKVSYAP